MIFKVRLFEAQPDTPDGKHLAPKEIPGFTVDSPDVDAAREVARAKVVERGLTLRSLSILAGKPLALAAVVQSSVPKEAPK